MLFITMKKLFSLFLAIGLLMTTLAAVEAAGSSDRIVSTDNTYLYVKENRDAGAVILPNAGYEATYPSWSPTKDEIVYMIGEWSGNDDDSEIWKVDISDIEDLDTTQLTDNEYADSLPDWSHDGDTIVWVSEANASDDCPNWDGSDNAIWIMDADGTNKEVLACGDWEHPEWSPDGTKILARWYSGSTNEDEDDMTMYDDLYIIDVDRTVGSGDDITRLTTDDGTIIERWAEFSPDGTKIAYVNIPPQHSNSSVYVIDSDGSNVRRVTSLDTNSYHPTWSPNGYRIMFMRYTPFVGYTLHSIESDCNNTVESEENCDIQLHTTTGYGSWFPAWGFGAEADAPDLIVTDVRMVETYSGSYLCYLEADVKNVGNEAASWSDTRFRIQIGPSDTDCIVEADPQALAVDQTDTVICNENTYNHQPQENYIISGYADNSYHIAEYDEDNNYYGKITNCPHDSRV
jgi:Tol biopolymer transport system component